LLDRFVNLSIGPLAHGIPCWAAWSVSSSQTVGTVDEFWFGKTVSTPMSSGSEFMACSSVSWSGVSYAIVSRSKWVANACGGRSLAAWSRLAATPLVTDQASPLMRIER
jgi:hypothetical protein